MKKVFAVRAVRDIVPMLREAFQVAMSGVPGPVFVELPIDILYASLILFDTLVIQTYSKYHDNRIYHFKFIFLFILCPLGECHVS